MTIVLFAIVMLSVVVLSVVIVTIRRANIYKPKKLYMTSPWRRRNERIEGAIRLFETIGPSTERPNL